MSNNRGNPAPSPQTTSSRLDWKGTDRYEVVRFIGEGGMGVVYEAFDREREQSVALKTLQNFSPTALYRFKQEFRTLADVTHPNLVHLYELVAGDDIVFFTMELVDGVDFVKYTRRIGAKSSMPPPSEAGSQAIDDDAHTVNEREIRKRMRQLDAKSGVVPRSAGPNPRRPAHADLDRLRPALRQLVEGVNALHLAGKLHRDIKPSNVLVTPAGRVVLLDFGVATELASVHDPNHSEREVVGTVRYMAPEQATEDAPTAASDWYSVGVVLYEALVGQAPFVGPRGDIVTRKAMLDPSPPRDCVEDVPSDLDALCCDLLRREATARPQGQQVLRRLAGNTARPSTPPPRLEAPSIATRLLGRASHLQALRAAFEDSKRSAVTVLVHGSSGMGKTALAQRFLDELVERGEAMTLRGRAYERESVPYKAFDSVVDALSRYLTRLCDDEGTVTLPADIWALARLFPVLRGVTPIAAALGEPGVADQQYIRRRAFVAMRSLLAGLARRKPIVIWIDDVQWGDVDSVSLLFETIRAPVAPPILFVMTYRDEEATRSPFVIEMRARWPIPAEVREIAVGPLAPDDAKSLSLTLLRARGSSAHEIAETIARESGGSAFLIEELVRGMLARQDWSSVPHNLSGVTLEELVAERLAQLDTGERRLVEIIAVGGRPLGITTAGDAAGIYEKLDDVIARLLARGFVRTGFRSGHETVEMSHDGIRETVLGLLSPTTARSHHSRLARVLESSKAADAEAIAAHLFGAGESQRAATYAAQAADEAASKLAFDQAARLYKLAIESMPDDSPEGRALRTRCAEVLEGAGRGTEAAALYLAAAEGSPPFERMELRRRAAEQLITSGHIDDGIRMMRGVMEAVGMRMPRTAVGAFTWALIYRLLLAIFVRRYKEREPDEVHPLDRARIDACHAVALSLTFVDAIYAQYSQSRHMLLALRNGDRFRVLRALSMHTVGLAARGGPETASERRYTDAVRTLTKRTAEPDAWVYVDIIRALCLFLHGRWREVSQLETDLLVALPHNRGGWRGQVRMSIIWGLVIVGEIAKARASMGTLLEDAENRGDLSTAVSLRVGYTNLAWLADDRPEEARRQIRIAAGMWSHSGFFLNNYRMLLAETNVDLYEGRGAAAYARVIEQWPRTRRSLMLFVQYIRVDAYFMRARAALASFESAPRPRARIAEATHYARALEREKMPWITMLAEIVWACVRLAQGDRSSAGVHLRRVIELSDTTGMSLHGAAARFQLGKLLDDVEGRKFAEAAEDWMRSQEIRVPARFAAMLIPGSWPPPESTEPSSVASRESASAP